MFSGRVSVKVLHVSLSCYLDINRGVAIFCFQVQRIVSSKSKKTRRAGKSVGGQDPLSHDHLYYKGLYLFPGYNPTGQPDT